ncbi:MAG TPA: hypothetical protein VFP84_36535 [Kofleriaceae bacterium]|nr:hypothetical protein [Kofleriaceae bacterium]
MGRTALYRDPVPFRSARAEVHLDSDVLVLVLPEGRPRRYPLDGYTATCADGYRHARIDVPPAREPANARWERRFVRMLVLERDHERLVIATPPEQGAVAPNVVRVPEAPAEAAIVEVHAWETLADWLMNGGRLAGCSIADLARLAAIATSAFAALIGEVAAQRALEHTWATRGPLRSSFDLESALHPLVAGARQSPRVGEALTAALAHAAGAAPGKRRA